MFAMVAPKSIFRIVGQDKHRPMTTHIEGTSSLSPTASRSGEHTSELQSLMRISYAVFCLKKKKTQKKNKDKTCIVKNNYIKTQSITQLIVLDTNNIKYYSYNI